MAVAAAGSGLQDVVEEGERSSKRNDIISKISAAGRSKYKSHLVGSNRDSGL
jgi:hypothetical protein